MTGGLGFIGSHLVESLSKKNHKIMVLTKTLSKRSNIQKSIKKIDIKKIDITNFDKLRKIIESFKPDVIIHLAGKHNDVIRLNKDHHSEVRTLDDKILKKSLRFKH